MIRKKMNVTDREMESIMIALEIAKDRMDVTVIKRLLELKGRWERADEAEPRKKGEEDD